MRHSSLPGLVRRRFLHCVHQHQLLVRELVQQIGVAPGHLCRIITNQNINNLPLQTFFQIARWLKMPLANVITLAGIHPDIEDLIRLGMEKRGYCPTSTTDQIAAAAEVEVSVAVFRRALHGYSDFRPSLQTCDRLASWLSWTGFESDDIAFAAGMVIRYRPDGRRVTLAHTAACEIKPYPCACGRTGCMVPAHIPNGPRRKWRSDACRMWAKRKLERETIAPTQRTTPLPRHTPIVRFIKINERPVPVRF